MASLPASVVSALRQLTSGDYSDFTIICRNREFKVHKVFICPESPYFKRVCNGSFKEATENQVTWPDDDPDIVAILLVYLYTKDLNVPLDQYTGQIAPSVDHECSDVESTALLSLLADKRDLPGLKRLAGEKLEAQVGEAMYTPSFSGVLEIIYENTVEGDPLRTAVTNVCLSQVMLVNPKLQTHTEEQKVHMDAALSTIKIYEPAASELAKLALVHLVGARAECEELQIRLKKEGNRYKEQIAAKDGDISRLELNTSNLDTEFDDLSTRNMTLTSKVRKLESEVATFKIVKTQDDEDIEKLKRDNKFITRRELEWLYDVSQKDEACDRCGFMLRLGDGSRVDGEYQVRCHRCGSAWLVP